MSASEYNSTYWLSQLRLPMGVHPVPCNHDRARGSRLRLFVYALPSAYHGQIIEYVELKARKLLGVKCAYLREDSCPNRGFSHLENLRSHCPDVPLMYKLLQSASVVTDAALANVFLVPFLMGCNAMLGWGHGMQRINAAAHHAFFGDFHRFADAHLPHFRRWPHRHLFLFPLDSMFTPRFLAQSMVVHTGAGYNSPHRIDVPIPYLVSLPPQPPMSISDPRDTFVFLMASPSRNPVRREIARQLRLAQQQRSSSSACALTTSSVEAAAGCGRITLYQTDPSRANAMPLSTEQTMHAMRRTVFCVAPTGDSDGFTQRFYYILSAGCIPVRVDSYYSDFLFGGVAWPFKSTIDWRQAVIVIPPERLRIDGLMPTLRNISAAQVRAMQQYILSTVRSAVRFDYRGREPDAFSAFLTELIHLSKTKLARLDTHTPARRATSHFKTSSSAAGFANSFAARKPQK